MTARTPLARGGHESARAGYGSVQGVRIPDDARLPATPAVLLCGLAEYLRRDGVVGVVVPDVGHLTQARCLAGAGRRTVRRYLRAAVLPVQARLGSVTDGRR